MINNINKKQIDFINHEFGVDVSKVTLIQKTLGNKTLGLYQTGEKGTISIDPENLSKYPEAYGYLTIMHELFHLLQFEYDVTLSLDLKRHDAEFYYYACEDQGWNEKALEVDARFFEIYYLWKLNSLSKDKLLHYGRYIFQNKVTDKLEFCAFCLDNKEFKSLIDEMIDSMRSDESIAI